MLLTWLDVTNTDINTRNNRLVRLDSSGYKKNSLVFCTCTNDNSLNLRAGSFLALTFFSFLGLPPSTGPFFSSLDSAGAAAEAAGAASGFLLSFLASAAFLSPFFYSILLISLIYTFTWNKHLQRRRQEQRARGHHQGWYQPKGNLRPSCLSWWQCFGQDRTNAKCWGQKWPWCFSNLYPSVLILGAPLDKNLRYGNVKDQRWQYRQWWDGCWQSKCWSSSGHWVFSEVNKDELSM